MTRALALCALVVSAVFGGFQLRLAPLAAERRVAEQMDAGTVGGGSLACDSESAYHLRRVELALVARKTPVIDRFLPGTGVVPWTPLFDAVLAAAVERCVEAPREGEGEEALGGLHERQIESFLAHMGPLLGGSLVLLSALCVVSVGRIAGRKFGAAAFVTAVLYALWPPALAVESAPRIALESWVLVLITGALAAGVQGVFAREGVDRLTGALGAGLCMGLALASGPLAAPFALLLWSLFFVRSLAPGDLSARDVNRAGLLFVASGFAVLVLAAPPALRAVGPAQAWLVLVLRLAAVGGVAFVAGFAGRWRGLLVPLATGGALVFATWVPSGLMESMVDALRVAFGPRAEWIARAQYWLGPLVCVSAGLALALLWSSQRRRARVCGAFLAAVTLGVLGWNANWSLNATEPSLGRHTLASVLRYMRSEVPTAGPWNAATTEKEWSVLAPSALGGLVAYHARRPPSVTDFDRALDRKRWRTARDAWRTGSEAPDEAEAVERFVARARSLGASYVLAGTGVEHAVGATSVVLERLRRAGDELESLGLTGVWSSTTASLDRQGPEAPPPTWVLYRVLPAGSPPK